MAKASDETVMLAKTWAKRGFWVFPVEVFYDEQAGKWQKVPLVGEGGFRNASDRIGKVVPAFRKAEAWRGGEVGIGCWPGPSGYVVADVDDDDALDYLKDNYGDFTEGAAEVLTPSGGSHCWFEHPGVEVDNTDLAPGINMRGDKGYVLLPDAAGYELEASSIPIEEVSVKFPDDLVKRLAENRERESAPGENPAIGPDGKVGKGGRNPFLFKIGSSLKYKDLPYEVIEAVLSVVNEMMCDPPHSESEVRRAARDAFRSKPINPRAGSSGEDSSESIDDWVSIVRQARERQS